MDRLLLMFLSVWLGGTILLCATYWLTRRIRPSWLRQVPRALVAALTFTPSLFASGHVGLVMPAIIVLYGAAFSTTTEWPAIARSVGLPFSGVPPARRDETGWVWSVSRGRGRADMEATVRFAADGSAHSVDVRLLLLDSTPNL
jgi:hypothetical protein